MSTSDTVRQRESLEPPPSPLPPRYRLLLLSDPQDALRVGRVLYQWGDTPLEVNIGRPARPNEVWVENQVEVRNDNVSRAHCRLSWRDSRWYLRDRGSSNGTAVGLQRRKVSPDVALDEERVEIALGQEVVVEFLVERGDDCARARSLMERAIADPLTIALDKGPSVRGGAPGAPADAWFVASRAHVRAACEALRAVSPAPRASVIALDLDGFRAFNVRFGWEEGDHALLRVARCAASAVTSHFATRGAGPFPWLLGRQDSDRFLLLLLDGEEGAAAVAEQIRASIGRAAAPEGARGADLGPPLTGTFAVCQLDSSTGADELLDRLNEAVAVGKEQGRDRVLRCSVLARQRTTSRHDEALEAAIGAIEKRDGVVLVGARLGDEDDVIHRSGPEGLRREQGRLRGAVEKATPGSTVGTWAGRYVVAVTSARLAKDAIESIRRSHGAPRVADADAAGREIRVAVLALDECGERSDGLRQLAERIDLQGDALAKRLPYPLVAHWHSLRARGSDYNRCHTVCKGIEVILQFVVAAQFALLRRHNHRALAKILADGWSHGPLSLGSWRTIAFSLAERVARLDGDVGAPIVEIARRLLRTSYRDGRLLESVAIAVSKRNKFAHGEVPAVEQRAYRSEEEELTAVMNALIEVMRPFAEYRLVRKGGEARFTSDVRNIEYAAHDLSGPTSSFRHVWLSLPAQPENFLLSSWCYLTRDGEAPLCLSPIVFQEMCEDHKGMEIFVADRIRLDPNEACVESARGVLTGCKGAATLPSTPDDVRLWESFRAERERP